MGSKTAAPRGETYSDWLCKCIKPFVEPGQGTTIIQREVLAVEAILRVT